MNRQELIKKAVEIAETVDGKGQSYGSIQKSAGIMRIIFSGWNMPRSLDDYCSLYLIMRIVDNLCRIGNGHHKDSWADIMGFALRGVEQFETEKPEEKDNVEGQHERTDDDRTEGQDYEAG